MDLYYSAEDNRKRNRPHRTPAQLLCRLPHLMLWWFPQRTFLFLGDSSYGTHEVARFVTRHRYHLTLISKLHPQTNLLEAPPLYTGKGRPRVKGQPLPKPRQVVQTARRQQRTVGWYGGGRRRVEAVTSTGWWYKSGRGLVPLRWVFIHDVDGTHRDEFFFCTDSALNAKTIIGHYTARWNIETTHPNSTSRHRWCSHSSACYNPYIGVA